MNKPPLQPPPSMKNHAKALGKIPQDDQEFINKLMMDKQLSKSGNQKTTNDKIRYSMKKLNNIDSLKTLTASTGQIKGTHKINHDISGMM